MKHVADVSLELQGLVCPMPLLKTKKALNAMHSGQLLEVISTDSTSVGDFQVFCRQTNNELVFCRQQDGHYYFLLRKA